MPNYLDTLLTPEEEKKNESSSGYLGSLLQGPTIPKGTGTDYLQSISGTAPPLPVPEEETSPVTTPPASITQGGGWFNRFVDAISRPGYAVRNVISEALEGDWRDIPQAFVKGWTGERPGAGRNIAQQLGFSEEPILSWLAREAAESRPPGTEVWDPEVVDEFARTTNIPFAGTSPAGAAGFALEIGTDPLSYVGVGILNRSGKALQRIGKLTGPRSQQALEGTRDLVTVFGRGPSSLPGRVGEVARRGQAAVFRGGEQAGEYAFQRPLVQDVVQGLSTRGVGPVAAVRRRLDERQAEEQFLGRRAERQYGQMRRDIQGLEKARKIPKGELGRTITEEAQRFPVSTVTETVTRKAKQVQNELTPNPAYYEVIGEEVPERIGVQEVTDMILEQLDEMRRELGSAIVEPGGVGRDEWGDVVSRWGTISTTPDWFRALGRSRKEVQEAFEKESGKLYERLVEEATEWVKSGYTFQNIDVPPRILTQQVERQIDVPEQVTRQVERPSLGSAKADEMVQSIRQRQPQRLAEERAAGVRTPEFESEEIRYLRREPTPEYRDWLRKNKKQGRERTPVLTLQHAAQTGRTVQRNATIAEINRAAIEGRTTKGIVGWDEYRVKKSDTLSKIAKRFDITVDELVERNNLKNENLIQEATTLEVPRYGAVITDKPQKKPYLPKTPVFEEDPAVIELARERMTIRSTTTARALDNIVETGTAEGWAIRAEDADAARELAESGWRQIDAPRFENKLQGVYFPKKVADEIDKFYELFTNKDTRNAVLKAISGFNRWWKNQTLFAFPEYHVRNLGTGVIKNYYADIAPSNAAAYGRGNLFALYRRVAEMAPRSERATNAAETLGQAVITAKNGRRYTMEEISDLYESHGLSRGYFEVQFGETGGTAADAIRGRRFQARRLNPLSSDNYLISAGRTAGTFIENNIRGTLFIEKLRQGFSPAKAAAFVRQYHYDYADIPDWLKKAREYAVPFITWSYKNLPNEIYTAITQPGKYSRIVGAARSAEAGVEGPPPEPEEVPSFLLLPLYRGRDEEGNAVFGNIFNRHGSDSP